VDPQAIRFYPATGHLLWATAGAHSAGQNVDPAVREATDAGAFVRELPKAANERLSVDGVGPVNGGFSGLALTGTRLFTALREPMPQDGTQAVRLTLHDLGTGNPLAQYAYRQDDVPGNGVAEILTVTTNRYLVLERAPVAGANDSVRLYEIDFTAGATNVLRFAALTGVTYTAVTKRLLLDFSALGLGSVSDIEGMTWGANLSDGRRTLIFVGNNHFQRATPTQLVALGVSLS
jgi:hypothetical protein